MYRYLFSPIQINRLEIKNRVAYPSLGLLYSKNGKLNDRYFNYFKERANGGAGLVTVGPVGVDFIGSGAIAVVIAAKGTITPETLHFLFAYEAVSIERLRELMFQGSSQVTVFEMLPRIGKDVGKSTRWILFDNLKRYKVSVKTGTAVTSIRKGMLKFQKDGQEKQMQFDNVVLASGSQSVPGLSAQVKKLGIPFATVGDGVRPGKLNEAIHGGFLTAMNI